jgi:hypothetical protein
VVWEDVKGPIPDGLQLLHHCDMPMCVNPDHLYPGTNADNRRDYAARRTRCRKGHWLNDDNVYRQSTRPHVRLCKQCMLLRNRQWGFKSRRA